MRRITTAFAFITVYIQFMKHDVQRITIARVRLAHKNPDKIRRKKSICDFTMYFIKSIHNVNAKEKSKSQLFVIGTILIGSRIFPVILIITLSDGHSKWTMK